MLLLYDNDNKLKGNKQINNNLGLDNDNTQHPDGLIEK